MIIKSTSECNFIVATAYTVVMRIFTLTSIINIPLDSFNLAVPASNFIF